MLVGYGTVSGCLLTLCLIKDALCLDDEPRHCSRFDYEEKLLEKMVRMETKMERIEKQVKELTETKQRYETRTPNVAFRAILSKDFGQVTAGRVIIFDQVELNLGTAYGSRHGFFTAPYNGTYLFSMKLGNPKGKPGAFYLKHNGKGIEYVIAGHTTGWNMGGVTTVAELFVDDQVWIQGEGYVSGAYATARYHTSFSGILLQTCQ